MAGGIAIAPAAKADTTTLSPFLQRLRADGLGRTVVLHTGRRTYTGQLLRVDAAGIGLEADSDEFEERCRLEIDPGRIEAFEIFDA